MLDRVKGLTGSRGPDQKRCLPHTYFDDSFHCHHCKPLLCQYKVNCRACTHVKKTYRAHRLSGTHAYTYTRSHTHRLTHAPAHTNALWHTQTLASCKNLPARVTYAWIFLFLLHVSVVPVVVGQPHKALHQGIELFFVKFPDTHTHTHQTHSYTHTRAYHCVRAIIVGGGRRHVVSANIP